MPIQQLLLGVGASEKTYVDDVFSTYLWKGTGSAKTITNDIDLAGEGGLVWIKNRESTYGHGLFDTVRGVTKQIQSNATSAESTEASTLTHFLSNGFTVNSDVLVNQSTKDISSWTFRKAKGFFDVVTFTQASGTPTNQRVSHSLGSAPGMILMKCTSSTRDWFCYHRGLGKDKYFKLNDSGAAATASNGWGTAEPDASEFGFNADEFGTSTGDTFVAYLFAHDDQKFGEGGNQSIIKCGSFNKPNGGTDVDVDLGWEPQFIFSTMYGGPSGRGLMDDKRGLFHTENCRFLKAHGTNAENNNSTKIISAKGFTQGGDSGDWLYMAIRIPDGYVGKPVEDATKVFALDGSGAGSPGPSFISNFPVDFGLTRKPAQSQSWYTGARLLKDKYLTTNSSGNVNTDAEMAWDYSNGFVNGNFFGNSANQAWMWKRHAGFDVVAYAGDSNNPRTVYHSLSKEPEMIWIKRRNTADNWLVGANFGSSNYDILKLNLSDAAINLSYNGRFMSKPTSTAFTVDADSSINGSGSNYLAILFASVDGISKVGYYSGSGSSRTITTGFQPRFLFIKGLSNGRNWQVLDTTRGWGSGNDNRLWFDLDTAQSGAFDVGAPTSTGFTLADGDAKWNNSGENYIYYAHA